MYNWNFETKMAAKMLLFSLQNRDVARMRSASFSPVLIIYNKQMSVLEKIYINKASKENVSQFQRFHSRLAFNDELTMSP